MTLKLLVSPKSVDGSAATMLELMELSLAVRPDQWPSMALGKVALHFVHGGKLGVVKP